MGYTDPKVPSGSQAPDMPKINPSILAPGQGGWSMDGTGFKIEDILTALQSKYGGSPGIMGKLSPTGQTGSVFGAGASTGATRPPATPIHATPRQPQTGGVMLGGSLFG
jgi:hypothetical protein